MAGKLIGERIKETRHSQGLTQEKLATKAGVSYVTLTKIESGAIENPSVKMVTKISRALDISIADLVAPLVRTLRGKNCISEILNNVYLTLKDSGGEVFISGIDEKKFLEADEKVITSHIKRLAGAGIKERLLAREGDSFFFSGDQSSYRWVPENLFNPTPVYVYGNKIAMIVWEPTRQVIIIENLALADAYRKQFLFIWDRAKIPPQNKTTESERQRLTAAIIKRFGGRVSPITDKDKKLFRDMLAKNGKGSETYGNSYFYLGQAANGIGAEKMGLKYYDGDFLATLGIFNRASLGGGWHFHIINPVGKFEPGKILALAKSMLELSGNPVYVKKINPEKQMQLLKAGFSPIEQYPWHSQAIEEDDTFPEQILDIKKTINYAEGPGKCDLKDKYQRFLARYQDKLEIVDLSEKNTADAATIVKKFFDYLEIKKLHISQPTDYDNIIFHPPLGKNGRSYFSKIVYINKKPVAFFAAESCTPNTVGLYANISLYQEAPYLSEYLVVSICKLLKDKFEYLNLGGSETGGLFQFKDKFMPVKYQKMHWVVYKF